MVGAGASLPVRSVLAETVCYHDVAQSVQLCCADDSTRNCRKIFDGLADRFKGTIAGEVGAPFVPTVSDASVLL